MLITFAFFEKIVLQNLWFAYQEENYVLKGLSFETKPYYSEDDF